MIRLRALEPEDIDALYQLENDMGDWEIGCSNVPFSRYALRDYIATNSYDIYVDKQLRQVITDEKNSVLGLIDLCNFDPRHQRAEVSILLDKAYRGKGIASESLRQLVDYCDKFLHLSLLYAMVAEKNTAAKSLFSRADFNHTATLKSWLNTNENREDVFVFQLFLKK